MLISGLSEVHRYENGQLTKGLPENLIWTYIIQISAALRCVHGNGMVARCMDLSRILVDSKSKYAHFYADTMSMRSES